MAGERQPSNPRRRVAQPMVGVSWTPDLGPLAKV